MTLTVKWGVNFCSFNFHQHCPFFLGLICFCQHKLQFYLQILFITTLCGYFVYSLISTPIYLYLCFLYFVAKIQLVSRLFMSYAWVWNFISFPSITKACDIPKIPLIFTSIITLQIGCFTNDLQLHNA